jgi:plasmid replication initiation protein
MNALAWLEAVLALIAKVEAATGQLPRFDGGKLIMPESESAKVAARLIDPAEAANALLQAACVADSELYNALTVAMLNSAGRDYRRLKAAMARLSDPEAG